jgi:hypothetical protein
MLLLEYKEIMQALTTLYAARKLINTVTTKVIQAAYESSSTEEELADSWYRVNVCRLFTETDVNIEGFLQSAMGLIVDAKEMVASLAAWGKGVTQAGRANILISLEEADANLYTVISMLEDMINVCL